MPNIKISIAVVQYGVKSIEVAQSIIGGLRRAVVITKRRGQVIQGVRNRIQPKGKQILATRME